MTADASLGSEVTTEDWLMGQARSGRREAFDRLYLSVSRPLFGFLARMAGPDEAPDLLQQVFLRAWRSRRTYRGSGVRAWLFRIARHCVYDHRGDPPAGKGTEAIDSASTPEAVEQARDTADRLDSALAVLPELTREAVLLSRFSELSGAAIGEVLGLSENAVKIRIHRGLKALQEALDETK